MFRLLLGLGLGYLGYVIIKQVARLPGPLAPGAQAFGKKPGAGCPGPGPGVQDLYPPAGSPQGRKGRHHLFFLLRRLFEALPE